MLRVIFAIAVVAQQEVALSGIDRSLLEAVRAGSVQDVRLRLAQGANPNCVDDSFWVPAVLIAAEYGRTDHLRVLLDAGADPNAQGHGIHYLGTTALMEAARYRHLEAVRLLLARGAVVDTEDDMQRTALIDAAGAREARVLKALLDHGADPRHKADDDYTALMAAATVGDLPSLRLLLTAGSDPTVRGREGRTAADCARLNKHPEAAHLILTWIAQSPRGR